MIERVAIIVSSVGALAILYIIIRYRRRPLKPFPPLQESDRMLLCQYVSFYRKLSAELQQEFEQRMVHFLSNVKITGVNTEVERIDQLFIAASAIIPIFNFHNWEYMNLNEVLLYPGSFDHEFNQEGEERTRAGVVGDGPYQNMMILSKPDLRYGFMNSESKTNTGIHEFVHLIDKTDGAVDGVPRSLVDQQYVLPWLSLMQYKIQQIHDEQSDIDPYGATNQAEFFAVASEYFFEQPELLQQNHPELYRLLTKIFRHKEDDETSKNQQVEQA
ncbi:zinc-dependent peptidase [Aridibaculum aurantiacum]|uniref:M90 family metallopeptidase n=1 Tax=Aridibaculum aurantiacum TaxID=2810307 RepID=UPI001A96F44A|nr:M90 family metallopeptidase [Aridibaculum aurantiacum]